MKSLMSFLKCTAAVVVLAAAPLGAAFAVPTFSFSSNSGTLHPAGSQFAVDILASGVSDLYAYQFTINFNPSFIHVLDVIEGPFLSSGGATFFDGGTIDNVSGSVSFTFDTLISAVPGVSGSGILAHLDLSALASGTSTLAFSDLLALNSVFDEITITAVPISLAVPEPSTVAMLFLGAGLVLFLRRRVTRSESRSTSPFAIGA